MNEFLNKTPASIFGVLIILLFTVSSCEIKDIELREVQNVQIDSVKKGEIKGTITLLLENPNRFSVNIVEGDFELWAGKTKMGTAVLNESFKIDAKKTKAYPIKLDADVSSLLSGGLSGVVGILMGKDPKVSLKGEIKVKSFIVSRTVPVEMETNLPLSTFMK